MKSRRAAAAKPAGIQGAPRESDDAGAAAGWMNGAPLRAQLSRLLSPLRRSDEPFTDSLRALASLVLRWTEQRRPANEAGFPPPGAGGEPARIAESSPDGEERYRSLFTKMSEGFAVGEPVLGADGTPTDFRFMDMNDAFERQSGLRRADVLGRPLRTVLPALEQHWVEAFCGVALSGQPRQFEEYSRDLDRHFSVYAFSPQRGRFAILFTDVTERERSSAQLRHAAELLDLGDPFAELDHEWRYVRVNARYEELSRTPREKLLGRVLWEVWPVIAHPDSRYWREYQRAVRERVPVQFEEYYAPLDLWTDVTAYPTSTGGLAIFVRDVTTRRRAEAALRRSEEQRRLALRAADLGSWDYNVRTGEVFWDERFQAIYGAATLGMPYPDFLGALVHAEDRARLDAAVARTLDPARPDADDLIDIEYRVVWSDGSVHWVHVKGEAFFERQGAAREPVRFVGTVQEITDRKRAEEELRVAHERLRATEERYRLVGLATHDVIWDWDLTNDSLFWNEAVEATFGYRRADVPSEISWLHDHIHPDDRPRVVSAIHGTIDDPAGRTWTAEYRFRHRDGRWIDVLDRGLVARDERGRGIRMIGSMLDMTASREAERRLRRVLEASPMGALLGDAAGRVLYANDAYLRMIGASREQLERGEVRWDLITPPEHGAADAQALAQAMSRGVSDVYEKEYLRPDGERVSVLVASASVGGGELAAFALDISERKRSERALRRALADAEERRLLLETMLDNIPIGITIATAPDVTTRFVSRYGRELLEKTSEELTGLPAPSHLAAWQIFHPGTMAPARVEELPLTRATLNGEQVQGEEWVILRKDGSPVPILCTAAPIRDQEGRITGGVIGWQDITDRKRVEEALRASEEKFRSVFEQAAIGMGRVRFDDARWIDVNDVFCRMVGYSREEMLRTPWPELTHPDDIDRDLVPFRRMARGELDSYSVEKRFIHKSGRQVWARLTLSLVRDAKGRPDTEIAIIEDVSDRKKTEQDLSAANARLMEVDQRKNEFLAMLSHELRNPLAPINNSLYILERATPGGPQATRARQVIGRQVVHMTRLIDDLLDVTRISRGKVRLQRERIDLCELVHRTAEDHRTLFNANDIQLEVGTCQAPLHADADPTRLSQVVGNLLTNAAKFTARGGRVELSLGSEAGSAVVRVRDNGAGITPELLGKLFEPFVQADATLDRSKGGLGLGLALVKGLVELHGGTVSARSEGPGRGAEFVVRVPLELAREDGRDEDAVGSRGAAMRSLRVLLIEDNLDSAETLKEALELNGHRVETAGTGHEGIEKARAFRPDVVLCDIGLPGIDGFEVARRMRADPELRAAPLVALSGYAQPEDVERSREAGFTRHLAKPPELGALERTLVEATATAPTG